MTSETLWKRQYRLHFPDLGFSFDNIDDEAEGLKISFKIDKDVSQESNKSELKIWNLKSETREKIEKADTKLEIYAGYKDTGGPVKIYTGSVLMSETKDEGKDVVTELKLGDGADSLRDTVVSLSFPPDTDGRRIADTIAGEMGLTISYAKDVLMESFKNGFSHAGYAKDAMTTVCNAFGCDWSIQNGIIQVIMAGGTFADRGIVFSPESGLVGSPHRINQAKPSEDKENSKGKRQRQSKKTRPEKKAGWEISTLLAPSVNPGDAVKVESRMIKGWFRVESISHAGDSYGGGQWESKIQLIEGLGT